MSRTVWTWGRLAACLPGVAVLGVTWFRHTWSSGRSEPPLREGAAHA
jgi:hypothetical protein